MKLFLTVEDRNGSLNRGGEILIDISHQILAHQDKIFEASGLFSAAQK